MAKNALAAERYEKISRLRRLRVVKTSQATGAMEPQDFCAYWLETDDDRRDAPGYRAKCVRFLSEVLELPQPTIKSWGKGLSFEKTPHLAKKSLGFLHELALLQQLVEPLRREGSAPSSVVQTVLNARRINPQAGY